MKNTKIISESISLIDEIFKNKGRQNFIGILITGIGLTVTALGITVMLTEPEVLVTESEQGEEKIE